MAKGYAASLPGGTQPPRDPSLGPPLDAKWWSGVAENIIRQFLPYGAGDGPDPKLVDVLSTALQVAYGVANTDDMGEANVRKFLKSPKSPTPLLSDELMLSLSQSAAPGVQNRLIWATGDGLVAAGNKSASLAVNPLNLAPTLSSVSAGASKKRPKPPAPAGSPPDFFQSVIYANQSFDAERQVRQSVYDNFFHALTGTAQTKFAKDAAVMVTEEPWRTLYGKALTIAQGAAASFSRDDDEYHLPTPPPQPLNRSNWLVGELVHATWQFDYMASRQKHDIIAEYLYYNGLTRDKKKPQLRDYRTLDTTEEAPTLSGSARYAFGKYRPDIIDFTEGSGSIYEIKPLRGAAAGVLQLWRYTHNYNCSRYYDELLAAGAVGKHRFYLTPGALPDRPFGSLEVTDYIDKYFERKPGAAQSPWAGDLRVMRTSGKRIFTVPVYVKPIPGLILYMVHDKKQPSEAEAQQLSDVIKTGLVVVAVVAVVAAIVAATILTGGTAEAVAAGLTGGATQITTEEIAISLGSESLVIEELPSVATALDGALTPMAKALKL